MQVRLEDLVRLLALERLEVNLFRGESQDFWTQRVYGGQVLGQALAAANLTVDSERHVHSLHAYFLRAGDTQAPIVFEVDRQRDGGSFSNRRVVAIQHGRPILNLAASFHRDEQGLDHADSMPDVPPPDSLGDIADRQAESIEELPDRLRRFIVSEGAFDVRPVTESGWFEDDPSPSPPSKHFWIRTRGGLSDDRTQHEAVLAYISDYGLMTTAMLPHGVSTFDPRVMLASLDHAMWFHRPFRIDDWLLYSCRSSNARGARGLTRGQIFTADGVLVAETMQEGLMRMLDSQAE